ncbi:MAG: undecaprenyldiphospho-muramoylpentapeptide beta-N-acetylglucosaminyltransferase [Candidatus Zixiibacteriota bacterium]|nr:MAG: undecaprenyldiphospho-muramoylpentapeptide beta-N-acetylglucosaminyltransferase [candidate division Zixibacteria bacterium]
MKKLTVLFAGGGTGGHLYPALAIADTLRARVEPGGIADFRFIGTKRGLEYRMRDRLGYPLSLITVRGMYRHSILKNILFPILLLGAVLKSIYFILRFGPDLVVGTGGYVMGPVLLAAVAMNRRCVIQEQNSYPGVTTRQLAHKVDKVFLGFASAAGFLNKNAVTAETGNPVKNTIGKISKEKGREHFQLKSTDRVILVLGGSQGAASINQNILDHLSNLPDGYQLIWQTGERDYKEIAAAAGGRVESRALFPYTDRIELAYAAADIAIARAGALTLAELVAAGLPSVLVPYPYAAGDHQRKNAEVFVENRASLMIENGQLGEVSLLKGTVSLIEDGSYLKMAEAALAMRARIKRPAVEIIADEILELVGYEGSRD